MAETVIQFATPIQIPNSNDTVTTVDLKKIKDGLFFLSEPAYYVTKTGLVNCKFVSEIVYDETSDTLKCNSVLKTDNPDVQNSKNYINTSFEIKKEIVENLFRTIIEEDEYIFDIDIIKRYIKSSKELAKDKISKDKGLLVFDGDVIEGIYGKSGDNVVFNRILFEKSNSLFLGEVLYKDSKSSLEDTITMFLNNGMALSINISQADIKSSNKTKIAYVSIQGLMLDIKLLDNNQIDMKKFNTENICLPEPERNNSVENLMNKLIMLNGYDTENINTFYRANKSFFSQRINILNYMLS